MMYFLIYAAIHLASTAALLFIIAKNHSQINLLDLIWTAFLGPMGLFIAAMANGDELILWKAKK